MKRCYLAGPMRGYPQYNFPAFFAAAASLRVRGYAVWSPAENDVHEDGFDPAKDQAQPMLHYMKRDLPAVLDADFVAVLPGWERSQGATLEVTVARACGIPVLDAETLAEVPPLKSNSSQDTARLDWLEGEYERELKCTRTAMLPISIFRRNVPITRAMIDEAMAAEGHKPFSSTTKE